MLLSLVILSMVMASVTSAVIFASSANPDEDSAEATLIDDSRVLAQIADTLAMAKYILESSSNSVTVVVGDRNGDDIPDRIRYAWSGKAGDALTFQLNDETAYNLLDSVESFNLSYDQDVVASAFPGVLERGDSEIEIASQSSLLNHNGYFMNSTMAIGQRYTPALDADVVAYEPSRLTYYAERAGKTDGVVPVAIHDVDGDTPKGDAYVSATALESDLSTLPGWGEVAFSSTTRISDLGEKIITFGPGTGDGNITVYRYHNTDGTPFSYSTDVGATWMTGYAGSMLFTLYGYPVQPSAGFDVSLLTYNSIQVSLQSVADDRSPLTRNVNLMLAPAKLEAFAETGFDTDPTPMDLDGDGSPEWTHSAGTFPGTSIADGVWTADGQLIFQPGGLSTLSVISVTARMRSNDTLGPTIYGPFTVNADGDMLPIIAQLRSDGGTGQELVIYNDTTMTAEAYKLTGLPSGLIDIGLTVIPDKDYVYIEVNHQPALSVKLSRITDPGTVSQAVWFGSSGGVADFGSVYIKAGGSYTTATKPVSVEGGLLSKTLELVISK